MIKTECFGDSEHKTIKQHSITRLNLIKSALTRLDIACGSCIIIEMHSRATQALPVIFGNDAHHRCRLALLLEEAKSVTFKDHMCALPARPEVTAECFQRGDRNFCNSSFQLQVGIVVCSWTSHMTRPQRSHLHPSITLGLLSDDVSRFSSDGSCWTAATMTHVVSGDEGSCSLCKSPDCSEKWSWGLVQLCVFLSL